MVMKVPSYLRNFFVTYRSPRPESFSGTNSQWEARVPPFQPRFHQRETRQFGKNPAFSAHLSKIPANSYECAGGDERLEKERGLQAAGNWHQRACRHLTPRSGHGARGAPCASGTASASSASFARCRGTVRSPGDLSTCQSTPSLRNETLSQRATS